MIPILRYQPQINAEEKNTRFLSFNKTPKARTSGSPSDEGFLQHFQRLLPLKFLQTNNELIATTPRIGFSCGTDFVILLASGFFFDERILQLLLLKKGAERIRISDFANFYFFEKVLNGF